MSDKGRACREMEQDLITVAIGEAGPGAIARVETHAGRCAGCRQALGRYRAIDGAVATLRDASPPAGDLVRARERLDARLLDFRSRLVAFQVFRSPLGPIVIGRSEIGVTLVEYLDRADRRVDRLRPQLGIELVEDGTDVEQLFRELTEYLEGRRTALDWPLDLRLARSEFQRAVLRAAAAIPYGAVVSYKRLARDVGRPEAVRAVAQALRWNPLPIVIPCHRVVGSSGALTGYAGHRTERKQRLLTTEGVPVLRGREDLQVARHSMYVLVPGEREYCLPSCPPPETLRSGLPTLFASRAGAEAAGYAPCTTCRPDLHPLAPSVA